MKARSASAAASSNRRRARATPTSAARNARRTRWTRAAKLEECGRKSKIQLEILFPLFPSSLSAAVPCASRTRGVVFEALLTGIHAMGAIDEKFILFLQPG